MVILDIEFLKAPRPVGGACLYLYRSGAIRRRIREYIDKVARAEGGLLLPVDRKELLANWTVPAVLSGIRFHEFATTRSTQVEARELLTNILSVVPAMPTVVFAKYDEVLREAVKDLVLVIEEPALTDVNLTYVLEFLINESELGVPEKLCGNAALEQYIMRWLEEAASPTLIELSREVDQALLLYVNRATGHFEPPSESAVVADANSYIVRTLARVLTDGEFYDVVEFLRAVSTKVRRGWNHRELADDLCRATHQLIERELRARKLEPAQFVSGSYYERVWLWSLLLLTWAALLEQENDESDGEFSPNVVTAVEQLCREFGRRVEISCGDPLAGLWGAVFALTRTHGKVDETRRDNPYRLFRSLLANKVQDDEPQWIQTVRRLACSAPNEKSELITGEMLCPTLDIFSDLVGRPEAVGHLRRRFQTSSHRRPLAIIGLPASGKTTVARLYGKALLCEGARAQDGSPCGACTTCVSFDVARPFGYIEIDLGHPLAEIHVREHIVALKLSSFSNHRVVVFRNSNRAADLLDMALKPLEDGAFATTFVILSECEDLLRPSVLSRCDVLQTQGLGFEDCRRLLKRWLPASADELVADVIAMVDNGLPGKMARSARVIRESAAWEVESAKETLGVGWGKEALRYWQSILSEGALPDSALDIQIARSIEETVSHLRTMLWRIERRYSGQEAALVGLDNLFQSAVASLDACSRRRAISRTKLVCELATVFLHDCIVDTVSFRKAGDTARALTGNRA